MQLKKFIHSSSLFSILVIGLNLGSTLLYAEDPSSPPIPTASPSPVVLQRVEVKEYKEFQVGDPIVRFYTLSEDLTGDAKSSATKDSIHVKQRKVFNHYDGVIQKIYSDGTFMVSPRWTSVKQEPKQGFPIAVPYKELAKRRINHPDFVLNETVYTSWDLVMDVQSQEKDAPSIVTSRNIVGTIHELYSNGMAEVKIVSMDGSFVSKNQKQIFEMKDLSKEVQTYQTFKVGTETQFYSDLTRKKYAFKGMITRIFSNGVAEVKWTHRNEKSTSNAYSYWPLKFLTKPEMDKTVRADRGVSVLAQNDQIPFLAVTSLERGLRIPDVDYLKFIQFINLKRADEICQSKQFLGLASPPQVTVADSPVVSGKTQYDQVQILKSGVPENGKFFRYRPWSLAGMGGKNLMLAVGGAFVLAGIGFLSAGIGIAGIVGGIFYLLCINTAFLGALTVPKAYNAPIKASFNSSKDLADQYKTIQKSEKWFTKKIAPLVYKEIRCAKDPADLYSFQEFYR